MNKQRGRSTSQRAIDIRLFEDIGRGKRSGKGKSNEPNPATGKLILKIHLSETERDRINEQIHTILANVSKGEAISKGQEIRSNSEQLQAAKTAAKQLQELGSKKKTWRWYDIVSALLGGSLFVAAVADPQLQPLISTDVGVAGLAVAIASILYDRRHS